MTPVDLPARVLRRVYDHAYAYPDTEIGGVLVGAFPTVPGEPALVHGALPAYDARGDLTSLTFTHESWADLHAMREIQFPQSAIIGWYHSHPGHGIFLSEHDLFVHRNFFPVDDSLAFVMDPVRHEEGLYVLRGGELNELFVRPVEAPEATLARRRVRHRGPGHQDPSGEAREGARGSDPKASRATEPPSEATDARRPQPDGAAATASTERAAADTILFDLAALATATAGGLVAARFLW